MTSVLTTSVGWLASGIGQVVSLVYKVPATAIKVAYKGYKGTSLAYNKIGKPIATAGDLAATPYRPFVFNPVGVGSFAAETAVETTQSAWPIYSIGIWIGSMLICACIFPVVQTTIGTMGRGCLKCFKISADSITPRKWFKESSVGVKVGLAPIVLPIKIALGAIQFTFEVAQHIFRDAKFWVIGIVLFIVVGFMTSSVSTWVDIADGTYAVTQDAINVGGQGWNYAMAGFNVVLNPVNAIAIATMNTVVGTVKAFGKLTGHPLSLNDVPSGRRNLNGLSEAERDLRLVEEISPIIGGLILNINSAIGIVAQFVVDVFANFDIQKVLEYSSVFLGQVVCALAHPLCLLQEISNDLIVFLADLAGLILNGFLILFGIQIPRTAEEIDPALPVELRRCGESSFAAGEYKCRGRLFGPTFGIFRDAPSAPTDPYAGAACVPQRDGSFCQKIINGAMTCGATQASGCPIVAASLDPTRRRMAAITSHEDLKSNHECYHVWDATVKWKICPFVDPVRVSDKPPTTPAPNRRGLLVSEDRESVVSKLREALPHSHEDGEACSLTSSVYDPFGAAVDQSCLMRRAARRIPKRARRKLEESERETPAFLEDGLSIARHLLMRARLLRVTSEMDLTTWQRFKIVTSTSSVANATFSLSKIADDMSIAVQEGVDLHVRMMQAHAINSNRRRLVEGNDFVSDKCIIAGTTTPGYKCPSGSCIDPAFKCECPAVQNQNGWTFEDYARLKSWEASCFIRGIDFRSTVRSIAQCQEGWELNPETHPVFGTRGLESYCFPTFGRVTSSFEPLTYSVREAVVESCGGDSAGTLTVCTCPTLCASTFDFNRPWFGFLTMDVQCWFYDGFQGVKYIVTLFTDANSGCVPFSWIGIVWPAVFGFLQFPSEWVYLFTAQLSTVCFAVGTVPFVMLFVLIGSLILAMYESRHALVEIRDDMIDLFTQPEDDDLRRPLVDEEHIE